MSRKIVKYAYYIRYRRLYYSLFVVIFKNIYIRHFEKGKFRPPTKLPNPAKNRDERALIKILHRKRLTKTFTYSAESINM